MKKTAQKRQPPTLMAWYRSCQLALLVPAALIIAKLGALAMMWAGGAVLTLLRHMLTVSHVSPWG